MVDNMTQLPTDATDVATALSVHIEQQSPVFLDAELHCTGGEMLALVGPSGAGKSTILRIIAGLMRPHSGRIRCAGTEWFNSKSGIYLSPQQRRVGFVFQQYALFPHLSALGNVMQGCRHLEKNKRHKVAAEWLARVNLAGLENRRPAQLSGGQQQRVALARALAREPDVLLLDEPFSAVDRATRERLYQELAQLRRELEIPALLVTHDLDEAMVLSDRLCMLSQGVTLQSGPARTVITRPNSVLVARLVGMKNVFRATVVAAGVSSAARSTTDLSTLQPRPDNRDDGVIIEWRGQRIEVSRSNGFKPGDAVHWCVPQSHVVLHRRGRPSRGEKENPVQGMVADMVTMGDNALVATTVGNPHRPPIYLSVPIHVAERNGLASGVPLTVSLLADSIHLMTPDRLGRSRR